MEHQLGQRWLTHHSDDARWQEYALVHNLPAPRVPPTNLADSPEREQSCSVQRDKGTASPTAAVTLAADSNGSSSDHNHNQPNGSFSPSKLRC